MTDERRTDERKLDERRTAQTFVLVGDDAGKTLAAVLPARMPAPTTSRVAQPPPTTDRVGPARAAVAPLSKAPNSFEKPMNT